MSVDMTGASDAEFEARIAPFEAEGALEEFAQWIVSLDDDDPESLGRIARRTVTLTQIVGRARDALASPAPAPQDVYGCPDQPHHGVDCPGDACRYAAPAPQDGERDVCPDCGCRCWTEMNRCARCGRDR